MAKMTLRLDDNMPPPTRKSKYTPKSVIYRRLFIATLFIAICEAAFIYIHFNN